MMSLCLKGNSLTHPRSSSRTTTNGGCEGAGKLQIVPNGILHLAEQQEIWITNAFHTMNNENKSTFQILAENNGGVSSEYMDWGLNILSIRVTALVWPCT